MLRLKRCLELIYLTFDDPQWSACEIVHFWPFFFDAIFEKESKPGAGPIWTLMFDERCSEIGAMDSDPPRWEFQRFSCLLAGAPSPVISQGQMCWGMPRWEVVLANSS